MGEEVLREGRETASSLGRPASSLRPPSHLPLLSLPPIISTNTSRTTTSSPRACARTGTPTAWPRASSSPSPAAAPGTGPTSSSGTSRYASCFLISSSQNFWGDPHDGAPRFLFFSSAPYALSYVSLLIFLFFYPSGRRLADGADPQDPPPPPSPFPLSSLT
jgi:hypothetical protein